MTTPDVAAQRQARAERDARIITAWLAGTPARTLAETHGLSRARIYQILTSRSDLISEGQRRGRERSVGERDRHELELDAVRDWSLEHPGATLQEAVADLGVSLPVVREGLGERLSLHAAPPPGRGPVYDDVEVDAAVRAFVAEGGRRRADYNAVRLERGWPSSSVVIARHGTWTAALATTGQPMPRTTGGRPPFPDEALVGWLHRWYSTTSGPWTLAGLDTWLRSQEGAPSVSTVRSRFGSWARIRLLAQEA